MTDLDQSLHNTLKKFRISASRTLEIIDACPQSASAEDIKGNLPIHTAILYDQSLEVIQVLVEAYREGVCRVDCDGYLPLARACKHIPYSTSVISYLIDVYPDGLMLRTDGILPIHMLCTKRNPNLEAISLLASRCIESLRVQDNLGNLPIHYVCMGTRDSDTINALADMCPESLLIKRQDGSLPIHLLCEDRNGNDKSILYLAKLCPNSLKVQNKDGNLPLHFACSFEGKGNIVQALVDIYPEGLMVERYDGKLPIHVLCDNLYSKIETLVYVATRCPTCLRIKDRSGNLPIHLACKDFNDDAYMNGQLEFDIANRGSIVRVLAELYPESLMAGRSGGRLPIHILCDSFYTTNETILYLATLCSESLHIKDRGGYLPLHLACEYISKSSIIRSLVDLFPEALMMRRADGNLPIHIACQISMPSDIIMHMASRCPGSLGVLGSDNNLPIHNVLKKYSISLQASIIRLFVRLRPYLVHAKCCGHERDEREDALDIARIQNGIVYRILLNSDPRGIVSTIHLTYYRSMNWDARRPTILTMVQLENRKNSKIKFKIPQLMVLSKISKEMYITEETKGTRRLDWAGNGNLGYAFLSGILSFV